MTSARFRLRALLLGGLMTAIGSCAPAPPASTIELTGASDALLMFVGDQDEVDEDFILVLDANPTSKARGEPIASLPIGHSMSMPHHMEYILPPIGEPIFMNAHHPELTLAINIDDPFKPRIEHSFKPPESFRFPHDYARTPEGNRLVGFLRSEGKSPNPDEKMEPNGHGGIAEYSASGELIRTVSAAVPDAKKAVRPYAFALLPGADRFTVTSAPMHERSWADVVQIYSFSDFELLHTLDLKTGENHEGNPVDGVNGAAFGQHVLQDGSVFLNSYGCGFYHLTDIASDAPRLDLVYSLETPPADNPDDIRGACGIPLLIGNFWVQPVGALQQVVVLNIANPKAPREVLRFDTPKDFRPHWMSKDPRGNRLILGAELGGEQGFFILRFDEASGRIEYDPDFSAKRGSGWLSFLESPAPGYISLERDEWPHGASGPAWGHAALFLNQKRR